MKVGGPVAISKIRSILRTGILIVGIAVSLNGIHQTERHRNLWCSLIVDIKSCEQSCLAARFQLFVLIGASSRNVNTVVGKIGNAHSESRNEGEPTHLVLRVSDGHRCDKYHK